MGRIHPARGDLSVGMDTPITVSLTPGEVIAAGTPVRLESARPVDPRSAQGAITFRGARAVPQVTVGRRGHTVEIATGDLAPGAYDLVVCELLDTKGERLVERLVLPLVVGALVGAVPADLRVEHAVHLSVGELDVTRLAPGEKADGTYVEIVKAVDRAAGVPVDLAFDERGERIDADALLAEVTKRRVERFGRLHETLHHHLEKTDPDERVDVVVWADLDLDLTGYEKPAEGRIEEPPVEDRKIAEHVRGATDRLARALRQAGAEVTKEPDDSVPVVHVSLPAGKVRELAEADGIGALMLDDRTAILDLGASIAVARSDLAHNDGFDGTGIRVAVFEDGPSNTANLVHADRFTASPSASDHARLTHAVVKNVETGKPHGHAPDCDLYAANSSDNDALRWAARQGCTVISQSFHRSSEPGGAGLQADDVLKDYLALRWPYPTIVQAAGNFWSTDPDDIDPPQDEFVNHKGYNTLSVGNHDDTAGAMSGDSVFRNPSSAHGDRELPELAANGTGVSANGQTKSGTSFAAPATAGVAALLQDADGTLCSWPEGCRAILMASAGRNIAGSTWWNDVATHTDAADGAGAVDAAAGVRIAQQRRFRNAPATTRGWDVGTLTNGDIGADRLATFRHHVTVPRFLWSPTVKVALAWDSKVLSFFGIPLASTLTVDLDLIVRNSAGAQVAVAASWDNSYEVVEFKATRGETYEIVIRRWSGTDPVWYGLAWNVTGVPLLFENVEGIASAGILHREP